MADKLPLKTYKHKMYQKIGIHSFIHRHSMFNVVCVCSSKGRSDVSEFKEKSLFSHYLCSLFLLILIFFKVFEQNVKINKKELKTLSRKISSYVAIHICITYSIQFILPFYVYKIYKIILWEHNFEFFF